MGSLIEGVEAVYVNLLHARQALASKQHPLIVTHFSP